MANLKDGLHSTRKSAMLSVYFGHKPRRIFSERGTPHGKTAQYPLSYDRSAAF